MSKKSKPTSPARSPVPQEPSGFPRWLILGLLALVAFGAAYGVTLLVQQEKAPSSTTPIVSEEPKSPEEVAAKAPPKSEGAPGMVWIPPGEFLMGSDDQRQRNEHPIHLVKLDGFWMDETEVTNAQFRQFVEATKYVTTAEKAPDWEEMKKQLPPGTPKPSADKLVAGSLVFTPPSKAVPLDNVANWWSWVPGADWRHPEGPRSSIEGKDNHPVVHVSWDDAMAYAKWAGKRLPTEAEWEYASRGGLVGKRFTWGEDPPKDESKLANIWQGTFPNRNTEKDGFVRTAPVKTYKVNGFGLYDMAGNVWEWCSDWYRADAYTQYPPLKAIANPPGPKDSWDPNEPDAAKRSMRGGSFLCHFSYCESYRPSARRGTTPDTSMSHIGFRCVKP